MINSNFTHTTVPIKIKSFSLVIFLLLGWSLVPVHWLHHLGGSGGHYSYITDSVGNLVSTGYSSIGNPSSTEAPNPHSLPADSDKSHALCLSKNTKFYSASQAVYDFRPYFTLQKPGTFFVMSYNRSKIYLTTSPSRAPPFIAILSQTDTSISKFL